MIRYVKAPIAEPYGHPRFKAGSVWKVHEKVGVHLYSLRDSFSDLPEIRVLIRPLKCAFLNDLDGWIPCDKDGNEINL